MFLIIFGIVLIVLGVIYLINPHGIEEWRYKIGFRFTQPSENQVLNKVSAILLIGFGIFLCVKELI
jgi:hypothetical protein